MHPGPGAMPPDPAALAAAADATESGGGNASEEGVDAPAAAATKLDDVNGRRQTRRRWRLLQYLLGWVEGAALGGGGSVGRGGGGGGCGASVETEEALAVVTVALVAVTCPGPPAAEEGTTIGSGAGGRRRRQFLIETGGAPCPIATDFSVASDRGEWLAEGGSYRSGNGVGGGAIADGVWGGALDNLGPFLRYNGGVGATKRGWAAATARSVWGYDSVGRSAWGGGDGNLPMCVGFMASTLAECGTLLVIFRSSRC